MLFQVGKIVESISTFYSNNEKFYIGVKIILKKGCFSRGPIFPFRIVDSRGLILGVGNVLNRKILHLKRIHRFF